MPRTGCPLGWKSRWLEGPPLWLCQVLKTSGLVAGHPGQVVSWGLFLVLKENVFPRRPSPELMFNPRPPRDTASHLPIAQGTAQVLKGAELGSDSAPGGEGQSP